MEERKHGTRTSGTVFQTGIGKDDCLQRNTTCIRNIKKYLLATLFNAPSTMDNYHSALVNHDMYGR